MTTQNYQSMPRFSRNCRQSKNNRIALGAFIILIGTIILGKRLDLFFMPFHTGALVMLAIGIYLGVKHQFRSFGSWALISLGILFLIPKFFVFGVMSTHLVAPLILILLGIYLIVKPGKPWRRYQNITGTIDEDLISLDTAFGERTCIVTSKNFKGGVVNNTFGETKINMLQADSNEPMVLDMKVSFGSVEIVVPSHWEVEFEVNNSFASVEDKRYMRMVSNDEKKQLILKGSCSFGSIVVKSI